MPMLDAHIPRAPPPEAEDKLPARPAGCLSTTKLTGRTRGDPPA